MRTIAIIPARGGSKGIPGKNVAIVAGKPLIAYSIETALQVSGLSEVIVSSDADDILDVARSYVSVRIHKRSDQLATDESSVIDTICAILQDLDSAPDAIMLLQPTSPIRTAEQVEAAIRLLRDHPSANSLISVTAMSDVHPARMYWKTEAELSSILPEYEQTRRQEIPPAYYRNGAIYLVRSEALIKNNSVMVKPSLGFEMPASQLLNIDEPRDLLIAEPLLEAWKRNEL